MKITAKKSAAGKIAGLSIIAVLLAGALAIPGIADVSANSGIVTKLFVFCLGAVIVLQIVPGLMLLGAMFKGVSSIVGKREVIIADQDAEYRSEMANYFRKSGYRVETAESPEQALKSVMGMAAPVLLLGSDFGNKLSSSDLIHLFKKCSRNLHIVMVSDEMSLAQARQVRQEGIFFHALKPATADDAEELGQVVACAFEHQASVHANPASVSQKQLAADTGKAVLDRAHLKRALPWTAGLVALMAGANYLPWHNVAKAFQGGSFATWIFVGFVALIVTGQMLPIFRVKLKLGKMFATRESTQRSGK